MNSQELHTLIAAHGFHAIPIQMLGPEAPELPRFKGTLDEFWVATSALESKVVFLMAMQMDEADFQREVSSDDVPPLPDDEFDGEYLVDLLERQPALSKYRKYVDADCAFILQAKGGLAELEFFLAEAWWEKFQAETEEVVETWIAERARRAKDFQSERGHRVEALLKQLGALIQDSEFCGQRTQRAMLTYALEKIPDLEELGEMALKPEIQRLRDRIEAKGLNKRTRRS